jgi:hypothetical protein
MRQHPIPPVTEELQYRAIGVVRGIYEPADGDQLTRGLMRCADGTAIEAVVLGRLLTLMRRHLDLTIPHLWVVYPRSRDEQVLHLQLVGVWEPSTLTGPSNLTDTLTDPLADPEEPETPSDELPEGDDYFSVRGELIYTRPETGDLVVKVRQLPRPDGSKPLPFKLQIKGEIPLEHLRHFVALDLRRHGQELQLEAFEVIAPVVQRGNRGGKKSGRSGSAGGGAGGSGRGASRPGEGRGGEGRGSAGRAGRGNATDSSRVDSSRVDSSRVERPIKRGDGAARDGAAGGNTAKETEAAGAGVSHRLTGLRNAISRPAR